MRNFILATVLMLAPLAAHATSHEATLPTVAGEVRKVDKETGKLTLKHAPIPNLDMPDMTMVFRVKDPAMLDNVKAGDKGPLRRRKGRRAVHGREARAFEMTTAGSFTGPAAEDKRLAVSRAASASCRRRRPRTCPAPRR